MVTADAAGPSGRDLDAAAGSCRPAPTGLEPAARTALSQRLSQLPDGVALPARMSMDGASTTRPDVQQYLEALLARDPAVFLERYGALLQAEELALFESLRHDYEVNHYLQALLLQASTPSAPAAAGPCRSISATAKNRRLALMQRLDQEGAFFTEDSMRERAPLLWQQHVGRYEEERPLPVPGAGGALSEGLLAAHDEVQLRTRLQAEQAAVTARTDAGVVDGAEDAEELQEQQGQQREERVQDLVAAMQSRFLAGQEHADYVDYAQVGELVAGRRIVWAKGQAPAPGSCRCIVHALLLLAQCSHVHFGKTQPCLRLLMYIVLW